MPENSDSEAQHSDAARTTTESGAAAAAGLESAHAKEQAQADTHCSARRIEAGSSDR